MSKTLLSAFILVGLFVNGLSVLAQSKYNGKKVGIYYGWNRAFYSDSNISFSGTNYDFLLAGVKAEDRPTAFKFKTYFGLKTLSIPQTNYGIFYSPSEKWKFQLNIDHMKYVVIQNQKVTVTGDIYDDVNFSGENLNEKIELTDDFLRFEHTDGLNYINLSAHRIWSILKVSENIRLNSSIGISVGVMVPKTNATVLGKNRYDNYHLSGYGLSVVGGVNLNLGKVFFLNYSPSVGYINMPDIRISSITKERASQSFLFNMHAWTFGVSLPLSLNKDIK